MSGCALRIINSLIKRVSYFSFYIARLVLREGASRALLLCNNVVVVWLFTVDYIIQEVRWICSIPASVLVTEIIHILKCLAYRDISSLGNYLTISFSLL